MSSFAKIESSVYRVDDTPVSDSDILNYMRDQGMPDVPPYIIFDGEGHRFPTKRSKPNDDAGWYRAEKFGHMVFVSFTDYRSGVTGRFERGKSPSMTESERLEFEYKKEQHRIEQEQERRRRQDERAAEARRIWNILPDATVDNAYLKKKGVLPHGTKIAGEKRLAIPLYNENGDIRSLQFIPEDGKPKKYLWGTETGNCFWWLGDPDKTRVFLCEGFATGASIYEATGSTVFIAFSAGSIPKTAKILNAHGKDVTVVADNDAVGIEYAKKAVGCRMTVIPIEGMDANDYQNKYGTLSDILPNLSVVSKMILADDILTEDLTVSWLIKNWIPADSIGMIHGPSASGKTTIMLDMLLSASSGLPGWLDNRIRRPIGVVYLCGEGLTGVKRRIRAWKHNRMVEDLGNFAVYPLPLDLDKPEGIHEIRSQIDTLGWRPDIIVIDTVNRYMSGDENSAQDTRMLLNCVDSLRSRYSCSGLYVHHTGNSEDTQKRARGSSAWRGALDYEISVAVDEQSKVRCVEQVKMKDTELMPNVYGMIEGADIPGLYDDDGEQVTGAVFNACDVKPESVVDPKLEAEVNEMLCAYVDKGMTGRHISKKAWAEWYVENGKAKDITAASNNQLKKGDYRMIGRLTKANIISPEGDGWYIHDTRETRMVLGLLEKKK